MAKKIEWTETSILDRFKIYQFWVENNKSDSYSKKLERLFNDAAKLISEFPEIGTKTDFSEVKVKVIKSYKLFYLTKEDTIQIIRVWETHQDPDNLELHS